MRSDVKKRLVRCSRSCLKEPTQSRGCPTSVLRGSLDDTSTLQPMKIRTCAALVAVTLATVPAFASDPASGTFTATRACDALQSMRKQTNPGSVRLEPGTRYTIHEAQGPDRRW